MKKKLLFFLLVIFFSPVAIFSQFTGAGTSADPYNGGTLKTNLTWTASNSPIYVSGDLHVGTAADAGHLTIESGVTVRFVTVGADIIINGLGQLTADGTSGSQIRFTADTDKDGTYGETGETWGHISFESMGSAGSSSLTYCIFEYGRKNGAINTLESVGGGLQVNFNNITISDCIFRNNYAFFGGGIFVNISRNPSISRCKFIENTAREAGGGIYLHTSSSSVISSCLFDNNYADGSLATNYSGGGIQIGLSVTNAKVLNCTFVNNRSDNTGDAFYTLSGGSAANCIFWGSSDQTGFYTTSGTISYSAIQGYTAGSHFSNCTNLNSSNTASDGPNFTATDGSDWSIKFISPGRDRGTTPTPAVPNDYIGNARIGPYDMGAYEVQYSRWLTNAASPTAWTNSGNWEQGFEPGHSGTTSDVVIPALANDTYAPNISGTTTIDAGKWMILEPGAKATFATLTNNGTLKLRSGASGIFSLIFTSYSGNDPSIELYLSGGGNVDDDNYKWHYISTPVSSLPVSTFAPGTTLDVAQFIESRPVLSLAQGWVAYDGYVYSTGQTNGPTFSNLTPGKGYNYWDNANNTFTFSGTLNTSDVAMSLGYSGTPSLHGFNLLGNPFPSGLNWNDIINSVYFTYPANTSKGLYFTRDNVQCSYISGVGIPGDVTGIIPPMQGFFTKTGSTGNTITLAAAARTHNNIHAAYKGKSDIPMVRLMLKRNNYATDETVVRFDDFAKSYLDDDFDAIKFFISTTKTQTYSSLDGTNYAINGLPFPETFVEIPIVVNLTKDSVHTITATQLLGLDNYSITLTDNSTGFIADLKETPSVTFSAGPGTLADRFVLKVMTSTGVEPPAVSKNIFSIYHSGDLINIQTTSDEWNGRTGSVKLLDLTGKTVSDIENSEFRKNSLIQIQAPPAKGMYVVEIRSGVNRYVGKVIIR